MERAIQLLKKIQADYRPPLMEKALLRLSEFIHGYEDCLEGPLIGTGFVQHRSAFSFYLANFYGVEENNSWKEILSFFSNSCDEALELFIKHLKDFSALEDKNYYYKQWLRKMGEDEETIREMCHKNDPVESEEDKATLLAAGVVFYDISTIEGILKCIQKGPGAWLGGASLDSLTAYLDGYSYCKSEQTGTTFDILPGFQEFVEKYYKVNNKPNLKRHWSKIIAFYSGFNIDSEGAFDTFFMLYDKFRKKKNK